MAELANLAPLAAAQAAAVPPADPAGDDGMGDADQADNKETRTRVGYEKIRPPYREKNLARASCPYPLRPRRPAPPRTFFGP